jgi:glycosyltransferase involved in cell wall biosynthesis
MLSSKPIITCADSGCPTEIIRDGQTGLVLEPDAAKVADSLNSLWADRSRAKEMGRAGRAHYDAISPSWAAVAQELVS